MKTKKVCSFSLLLLLTLSCVTNAQNENSWTHFRGNKLDGLAVKGTYPLSWSDSTNVQWYTSIEGRGWSSPLVLDKQVWLSSASIDGKELFAVCLDLESGKIIHQVDLFRPDTVYGKHAVNSYATPTGVVEEGRVYIHFGRYGTACIDTESGDVRWKRSDLQCKHVQGAGSSLFLFEDKLIVHMEGTDVQEIYALDKTSGNTIWKAERNKSFYEDLAEIGKKAYVTPIVIDVDGRKLLISNGSAVCNAYDIETGEELWYIVQGEDSTISMPVYYNGKIFFYTSFVTPEEGSKYCELFAVDPRGKGDLSNHIIWRKSAPPLQLLTPVIKDGRLYTIDTRSLLSCINTETGESIWEEKLRGKYNSSPVIAGDRIYVSTTRGETLVFRTGDSFELLATSSLPGEIWATPAFVDNSILLRTSRGLYRLMEK